MLCLGCGENLPNAKDRRCLANPCAKDVVDLWKALMENEVDDPSVIGPILEGQDAERAPKMCKKCFTAYRTCAKQHVALGTNLRKAADILGLVCQHSEATASVSTSELPASKRPRLNLSSHSASHGSTAGTTTSSPDVAVSVLTFKVPLEFFVTLSSQCRLVLGIQNPRHLSSLLAGNIWERQ